MRVLPAVMSGNWRFPVQTIPVTRTSLIGSLKKRIQRSQEGIVGSGVREGGKERKKEGVIEIKGSKGSGETSESKNITHSQIYTQSPTRKTSVNSSLTTGTVVTTNSGRDGDKEGGMDNTFTGSSINIKRDNTNARVKGWARDMWRHAGRIVLEDLRASRPFGRWLSIARMAVIRKRYAFMYSKLLKVSKTTGDFVFDVNSRMSNKLVSKLFEYEMQLPLRSIMLYRALAVMICHVNAFNEKKMGALRKATEGGVGEGKQNNSSSSSSTASSLSLTTLGASLSKMTTQPPLAPSLPSSLPPTSTTPAFANTNITWADLLKVLSEVVEAQRETAFHRYV